MANISAEQAPAELPIVLREYLERMFVDIGFAVQQNNQMPILYSLPDKPKKGKIYFFGQVINPDITAEGYWGYKTTGWVQLG
jgi:hypothetical protein